MSRTAVTRIVAFGAAIVFCTGCSGGGGGGGSSSPAGPSSSGSTDLNGTWTGTAEDTTGPGSLTWKLAGSGASFSGQLTIVDSQTGITGRGTVTVTASGSSLTFTMNVPSGGFDSPYQACTTTASGSGTLNGTITGTYSGTNSCAGAISSGTLTLNKQ